MVGPLLGHYRILEKLGGGSDACLAERLAYV
jgi:hypothetical protein